MIKVFLASANLVADAQVRSLPSGSQMLTCRVGARLAQKHADGQYGSVFIDVSSFRSIQYLRDRLQKGTRVTVCGDLSVAEYTDRQGQQRTALQINNADIDIIGTAGNAGNPAHTDNTGNHYARSVPPRQSPPPDPPADEVSDDDLPF